MQEMIRFIDMTRWMRYPVKILSMHMGTNGTSYYFSVASESIGRFFDEMYLNTPWEQHYENLDSRTILDRLAAVKYFVVDKKNENRYLPYGFTEVKGES